MVRPAHVRLLCLAPALVPHAAKIPMSATSPEVVEWMHHCMPSDS